MPVLANAAQLKQVPIQTAAPVTLYSTGSALILSQRIGNVVSEAKLKNYGSAMPASEMAGAALRKALSAVRKQAFVSMEWEGKAIVIRSSETSATDRIFFKEVKTYRPMNFTATGLVGQFDAAEVKNLLRTVQLNSAHKSFRSADPAFVALRAGGGIGHVFASDGVSIATARGSVRGDVMGMEFTTKTWTILAKLLRGGVTLYRRDDQYYFQFDNQVVSTPVEHPMDAAAVQRFSQGTVDQTLVIHRKNLLPTLELCAEKRGLRFVRINVRGSNLRLGTDGEELYIQYSYRGRPLNKTKGLFGHNLSTDELYNPDKFESQRCIHAVLALKLIRKISSDYITVGFQSKPQPALIFSNTPDDGLRLVLPTMEKSL